MFFFDTWAISSGSRQCLGTGAGVPPHVGEFGKWHEYFTPWPTSCNATLRIDGDSIVNGVSYKKITADPGCSAILIESELRLLREDTLEKKVYKLYGNANEERLIYDFSLMPGDTFYWGNNGENILLLDSITNHIRNPFFCNGNNMPTLTIENPRVFYFDAGGVYGVVWIEGIGSLAGLLSSHYEWGGGVSSTLLCHFDNNRMQDFHYIYCEERNHCEGWEAVDAIQQFNTNKYPIKIFPNPAISDIYLAIEDGISFKSIEITLYDIHGQEKLKQKNTTQLNMNHCSSGIHFLKIVLDQQQIYTHKVIKQ